MLSITITKEINGKNEKFATRIDEDTAPMSELNEEIQILIGALLDKESASN